MYLKPFFNIKLLVVAFLGFTLLFVSCSTDAEETETEIVEESVDEDTDVDQDNGDANQGDDNNDGADNGGDMGDTDNGDDSDTGDDTSNGAFGLDANLEPWENFDLSDWNIDTPAFDTDGFSLRHGELNWGPLANSDSRPFFFTHTDGGMRFVSTVGGAKTSQNTRFSRSELREMLRAGNTNFSTQGANGNNWALGYQPGNTNHGGRNGVLTATLRVNKVTTTGNGLHPGRTIIGQIHADNDEPARLYYRKLPNADFGCIYLEHEIRDGNDVSFNLIGDEDCEGNGPSNGIQLDELFSYEIINDNELITVRVRRGDNDGEVIAETTVNMNTLNSGYDRSDEWMYFKAGLYTQNDTGDDEDEDIATYYRLSNTHDTN